MFLYLLSFYTHVSKIRKASQDIVTKFSFFHLMILNIPLFLPRVQENLGAYISYKRNQIPRLVYSSAFYYEIRASHNKIKLIRVIRSISLSFVSLLFRKHPINKHFQKYISSFAISLFRVVPNLIQIAGVLLIGQSVYNKRVTCNPRLESAFSRTGN